MPKSPRYYYNHETCSFVEEVPDRKQKVLKAGLLTSVAFIMAAAFTFGLDQVIPTAEEVALESENQALLDQLQSVSSRMRSVEDRLRALGEVDQSLYRALLEAEPISEDIRQVGVGGVDAYDRFSRYSPATAKLLRQTSQDIDQLERLLNLQSSSYRELASLAEQHSTRLTDMPAILPTTGPVVSGFGMRRHPILKIRRPHRGIDVLVPTGTEIVAPGDGVVKEAGRGGGFGKFVRIEHTGVGYLTTFAHLSEIPAGIKRGVRVKRGDIIGYSGNTGLSKAPHLHYEVRDKAGKAYNPIYFFAPTMTPSEYKRLLEESEKGTISLD
jgi:murein DD-endopeptidase MepM/ murein hydrolase activator NlpD